MSEQSSTGQPGTDRRVRHDEWRPGRNWIRRGDVVRVRGKRGLWRFVALITNTETGKQSVELVGPDHSPMIRTLPVEVIKRVAQTEVVDGEVRTRRNINHVRREAR